MQNGLPAMHLLVRLGSRDLVALVDTGSAVTLITQSEFQKLSGMSESMGSPITLTAFGGSSVKTIGSIECSLEIGETNFSSRVHVVDDKFAFSKMLIGRDVLGLGVLSVVGGGVVTFGKSTSTLTPRDNSGCASNEDIRVRRDVETVVESATSRPHINEEK